MDEKLIIKPEDLETSSNVFNTLMTDIQSLSSTVSGYNTSPEKSGPVKFDVDVASITSVISKNIGIVAKRVGNIKKAISEVSKEHKALQTTLDSKFPLSREGDAVDETPTTDAVDTTTTDTLADTSAAAAGGGGGGGGGGSGSGKGSKDGVKKPDKKGPVETELTDVGYVYADTGAITEETRDLLTSPAFTYDENGFARMGDRYVVACDYTVGNIGDVIRFTQKTGEVIECVIGINTFSEKYKHTLNFVVNPQVSPITPTKLTAGIIENNLNVDNIGPLAEAGSYTYVPPVLNDAVITTRGD